MATSSLLLLFLFFSSCLLFTTSLSGVPPSTPVAPGDACNSPQDPAFCMSVHPNQGFQNLYSYGRFYVAKSFSNAQKFLNKLNRYHVRHPNLSEATIQALEDCRFLSELNVDFLLTASVTLNSTTDDLPDPQTDNVHTLLSALLTNQQTCIDGLGGLNETSNDLSIALSNGTKLFSFSLALFKHAWVRKKSNVMSQQSFMPSRIPKRKRLLFHEVKVNHDGSLPLKMSSRNQELYERRSGRRLLQVSDSVVVSDIVVVSQDGTGNFTTITDAVASAPNNTGGSNGYFLIYVNAGVYAEYVSIPKYKTYLMMIGDGINQTIVTGNRSNVDGWTTFNSATFVVVGQGFVAINMTFQNTAGAIKHQAVAVRNGADLSSFYSCSFEGYQDTLYTHSMRQFYRDCDIYGTVDFIFGNAAVVFQKCNIYSRLPMEGQTNTITAQGRTDPNQNTGTSIQDCNFVAAPDLAAANGSTITYLGRPWKQYSLTVIMQSFIDRLIDPAGWMPWNGDFALSTLYYAEFNNTGPGSDTSKRVSWLGFNVINRTVAIDYTVTIFVFGDYWLPQTGVPYFGGLI